MVHSSQVDGSVQWPPVSIRKLIPVPQAESLKQHAYCIGNHGNAGTVWDSESPMLWQCKGSVHNCHENIIKNLQVSAWPKQRRRTKQRCRWKPVKSTPIEMTRKGKRKHAKGGRKADQTIQPKVNSKRYPSEDSMSMVECGSKCFKYLQYFLNSETSK